MHTFAQYMMRGDGPRTLQAERGDNWLGPVLTVLIVLIIAAVAVYLIKTIAATKQLPTEHREPIEVAKERFAKGEISKDELDVIRKELS